MSDPRPELNLPDGSMPTGVLTVVGYIDSDGTNKFAVAVKGDLPMTSYLGLLTVAQQEVLGWGSR